MGRIYSVGGSMEEKNDNTFEKDEVEEKETVNKKAEKVMEDSKKVVNSLFSMDEPGNKLLPKLLSLAAKIMFVASIVPFILFLFNIGFIFGFRGFVSSLISTFLTSARIFATALILQAVVRILIATEKE